MFPSWRIWGFGSYWDSQRLLKNSVRSREGWLWFSVVFKSCWGCCGCSGDLCGSLETVEDLSRDSSFNFFAFFFEQCQLFEIWGDFGSCSSRSCSSSIDKYRCSISFCFVLLFLFSFCFRCRRSLSFSASMSCKEEGGGGTASNLRSSTRRRKWILYGVTLVDFLVSIISLDSRRMTSLRRWPLPHLSTNFWRLIFDFDFVAFDLIWFVIISFLLLWNKTKTPSPSW